MNFIFTSPFLMESVSSWNAAFVSGFSEYDTSLFHGFLVELGLEYTFQLVVCVFIYFETLFFEDFTQVVFACMRGGLHEIFYFFLIINKLVQFV